MMVVVRRLKPNQILHMVPAPVAITDILLPSNRLSTLGLWPVSQLEIPAKQKQNGSQALVIVCFYYDFPNFSIFRCWNFCVHPGGNRRIQSKMHRSILHVLCPINQLTYPYRGACSNISTTNNTNNSKYNSLAFSFSFGSLVRDLVRC